MARKLLTLSVLALAVPAGAGAWQEAGGEVVDRIVAVVDEDPILLSDLERVVGLGLVESGPEESEADLARRVLERMIDERLRYHELDRFGFTEMPLEQIDEQVAALSERFGGAKAFEERLSRLGMDLDGVRQLVARQLMVLIFVEERLGPRVFVDLEQIRAYYDDVLVPEAAKRGESPPPLAEIREQVRAVVKERRLNEELERWTEELRREADIENYFDEPAAAPPEHLIHSRRESGR